MPEREPGATQRHDGDDSMKTIIIALLVNLAVAAIKAIAGVLSASAGLLAEAALPQPATIVDTVSAREGVDVTICADPTGVCVPVALSKRDHATEYRPAAFATPTWTRSSRPRRRR